jgi:hypothetical protein
MKLAYEHFMVHSIMECSYQSTMAKVDSSNVAKSPGQLYTTSV